MFIIIPEIDRGIMQHPGDKRQSAACASTMQEQVSNKAPTNSVTHPSNPPKMKETFATDMQDPNQEQVSPVHHTGKSE